MIFTFAGDAASRAGVGVGLGVRIVQEEPACRMFLGLRVAEVMGLTAPGQKAGRFRAGSPGVRSPLWGWGGALGAL